MQAKLQAAPSFFTAGNDVKTKVFSSLYRCGGNLLYLNIEEMIALRVFRAMGSDGLEVGNVHTFCKTIVALQRKVKEYERHHNMQRTHYRRTFILLLLDVLLLLLSFYISCVLFKATSVVEYMYNYRVALVAFSIILTSVSYRYRKYFFESYSTLRISINVLKSHLSAFAMATMCMYLIGDVHYSRLLVLSTIAGVTVFNLLTYNLWAALKRTKVIPEDILTPKAVRQELASEHEPVDPLVQQIVKEAVLHETSPVVLSFLEEQVNLYSTKTSVMYAEKLFPIRKLPSDVYSCIVNLARMNDVRFINKFFETANAKLSEGGLFVCRAETLEQYKVRMMNKYPLGINYIVYAADFIVKRVMPILGITQGLFFTLTKGKNRVLSLAELLGRLYSCGFAVLSETQIEGLTVVVAQKKREPYFDTDPTYGPLIRLVRVGKGGQLIKVYKFRTMHPYSEYLQEYVYQKHNLQDGGKFKDDFRVSTVGRIMRKLWIDEWPMFVNLFKGEMKLVGVRPLSRHYFGLYTPEMQARRIGYKPGLVPPFYVDNPRTLDEIMDSERRYFDLYDKHPFRTDVSYFFRSVYNIVFKKLRSK